MILLLGLWAACQTLVAGAFPLRVRIEGESESSSVRSGQPPVAGSKIIKPKIIKIELETYLPDVVLREMDAKRFPDAALQVQAIAARTYAVVKARQARAQRRSFDLESSVLDQVFQPATQQESEAAARAKEAVVQTKNLVLVDEHTGRLVTAYYHSTCGGRTELPQAVWGKKSDSQFQRRQCSFCADSPRARWESRLSAADLEKRLALQPGERIMHWQWSARPGERVYQVQAQTSKGRVVVKTGQELRAALGFDVLRSLWLEPPVAAGADWVFRGRGAGHGVGLCQWGARGAALQGWDAEKILSHYYPFARIVPLGQNAGAEEK